MKLILKYLKPYVLVVLAIILFTFLQVQTELTLPDYMSGIVTNGIQYGGITEEVPLMVSKKDMDTILSFADSNDANKILSAYQLVNKGSNANIKNQEITFDKDTYLLIKSEK